MAATVAGAAMVAAIPDASAGFRYVPPDRPAVEEADPASGAAGPTPGGPARAEPGGWRVRAGETLREALDRWGARAGVDVLFLTDRRYRLGEGRAFEGGFGEAARTLLAALAHLPHPPVGELSGDGRTLAVLHSARRIGDDR